MTRALLRTIRDWRLPLGATVMVYLFVGLLLPLLLVSDLVVALRRAEKRGRVLAMPAIACPQGHPVELVGAFRCPSCHLVAPWVHGFDRCGFCGEIAAAISCACGASVVNPLFEREESS